LFNRVRTKEVFGYDIDPDVRRRTKADFKSTGVFKKQLIVIDNCPSCGKERQIRLVHSRKNKPCSKCFHNTPEMKEVKKNNHKIKTEKTRRKMRESHWSKRGMEPPNVGVEMDDSFKENVSQAIRKWNRGRRLEDRKRAAQKAACTKLGIPWEGEDKFIYRTPANKILRDCPEYNDFEKAVIARDRRCAYPTCVYHKKAGLVVHHKDGYHWCEKRRHDIDNGVLLCKNHHRQFHNLFGSQNNTEEQFNTWIESERAQFGKKIDLIVLAGASGSGKTWVSEQLTDEFSYVPYDKTPKERHIMEIMKVAKIQPNKPVLYDPTRKARTIFNRYCQVWNVKLIFIDEAPATVAKRLVGRGGKAPHNIDKIIKSMARLRKVAHFSGTSDQVLDYLRNLVSPERV
jgi:hypothetical protein